VSVAKKGEFSTVGPRAEMIRNINANTIVVGIPAKSITKHKSE
jgi:serine acetyltransferase